MNQQNRNNGITLFAIISSALAIGAFFIVTSCSNRSATAGPHFIFKDAPKPGILAKINGEEITEELLVGDSKLEFLDLKKKEYELRMAKLNDLLVERLAGDEAKKAGLSLEEFMDKKVIKGNLKVANSEYEAFVKQRNIPKDQINDQLKERIMGYLTEKKRQDAIGNYIAGLTKKNPVEVYFQKPKMKIDVDAGQAPTWGKKDAKVTIYEFSDFQCPFCSKAAATVDEVKKKYSGKVKIIFKHFPLPMHPEAKPASEASMCIHEQNADKFWKYHDILFKNQKELGADKLEAYAKDVGADMAKFKECMSSKKYQKFVEEDLKQGEKIGVRSTPTFFINGEVVSGALPLEAFSEIIDAELK